MKTDHYRALLKLEIVSISAPLVQLSLPLLFGYELCFMDGPTLDGGVFAAMTALFGAVSSIMAYLFFFPMRTFSKVGQGIGPVFEFQFTRAVDRRSLYWSKMTCFGLVAAIPFLFLAIKGVLQPNYVITLSRTAEISWSATQQFYMQHFPGAKTTEDGADVSVFLPYAHAYLGLGMLFFMLVTASTYQALMLQTQNVRWGQRIVTLLLFVVPAGLGLAAAHQVDLRHDGSASLADSPPILDRLLGWSLVHSTPLLLSGLAATAIALYFGRRSFAKPNSFS